MTKIKVRVPATTANLGPGFDCLGLALDMYDLVSVEKAQEFRLEVVGEGVQSLSRGPDNRVYHAISRVYEVTGKPLPALAIRCENHIPLARGLGSSAAAIVAGLLAGNALLDEPLASEEVFSLAATLEGHADNVAAALFGGLQVVVEGEGRLLHIDVPFPSQLKAILYIPGFELPTQKARSLLPGMVSRTDAVYNVGRAALLVAALAQADFARLEEATRDRLHQPYRQALFPAMGRLIDAALEAGARAAFLSGAGPTIVALADAGEETVAEALQEEGKKAGLVGQGRICKAGGPEAQLIVEE